MQVHLARSGLFREELLKHANNGRIHGTCLLGELVAQPRGDIKHTDKPTGHEQLNYKNVPP